RVVAPVTAEDGRPAQEDLAVVGDPHADPRHRLADGTDLDVLRPVHRRRRAALGQPVPLQDGDPGATEAVAEPFPEGGASGYREPDLAAHRGAQLGVDQTVEERVPEPQLRARAASGRRGAGPGCLAPRYGGTRRGLEDAALHRAGRGLLLRAVVDLLE